MFIVLFKNINEKVDCIVLFQLLQLYVVFLNRVLIRGCMYFQNWLVYDIGVMMVFISGFLYCWL